MLSDSFEIYDEISDEVMNSFKSYDKVCLVNYGHPSYLVNVTQTIIKACREENIEFNIVPGISSIDAMWCIINKDSGYPGLQIIESEVLINYKIEVNPKLDLYIPHITEFMIPFSRKIKVSEYPEGIIKIKNWLLNYYNSNQKVAIIAISPIPTTKDAIILTTLSELSEKENLQKYIRGMTLFIQGIN